VPLLGLPGNPVSSLVCSVLFLRAALLRLLGAGETALPRIAATLGADLPANDRREDYLRATVATGPAGETIATPFAKQDSSMLSLLARADGLLVRAPHAPSLKAGAPVQVIGLRQSLLAV
jgi:molybdopterin molybdotransferase